ncbi:hypothetical protein [Krasilnikovia sp. M28-CT-15]|uniref:AMIN-like domain-containing (lipo)protein n=1 Tax=Krasilnikovia sp. M28-CT-15 TaxID=3373540 RepID=UPI003875D288
MRTSVGRSIAAVLCLALAGCGAPAADRTSAGVPAGPALAAATTTAPSCGITWGSGDKTAGPLSTAPLVSVQTGRHDCWDEIVFEFNGTAQGYSVRYSDQVPTDGEGLDLVPYTAGDVYLWVTLRAPAYDADHVSTIDARSGEHVANVLRYGTLRDVVFGGSFEGYTTFAVGARARLPFRVQVLAGPGTHSRIVVDIAHRW